MEEGAPDSFADLDAKLKALEEKTKAELAKLQSDTAAPSSFAEEQDAGQKSQAWTSEFTKFQDKLKGLGEKTKADMEALQESSD